MVTAARKLQIKIPYTRHVPDKEYVSAIEVNILLRLLLRRDFVVSYQ
jgi:hypothetical protein